ncbi:hypothetical protein B0H14DRAFT_2934010 [Mycena olivaceomarginata]|nr:hypothetical protein B0H14DRAFT_2934010 [Mycena olivaceomarginata]
MRGVSLLFGFGRVFSFCCWEGDAVDWGRAVALFLTRGGGAAIGVEGGACPSPRRASTRWVGEGRLSRETRAAMCGESLGYLWVLVVTMRMIDSLRPLSWFSLHFFFSRRQGTFFRLFVGLQAPGRKE